MGKLLLIFATVFVVVVADTESEDNIIDRINKVQNYWKAGRNEVSDKGIEYVRSICGAKFSEDVDQIPRKEIEIESNIPDSLDARIKWSKCESISSVKNQGGCGSCWAISTASAASDRLCIKSRVKISVNISAENLLSCCSYCPGQGMEGCDGGNPLLAWSYFQDSGLVTGGDYNSGEGCQPYQIQPTGSENYETPACQKKCTNKRYGLSYRRDKHFGKSAYFIPQDVTQIQSDIMNHGPVVATFEVYSDFQFYQSGVYTKTSSQKVYDHAVRVIGWGEENGVPYWLVANSWGSGWGEDGFFKIRRGTNECNFEGYITAGEVKK